MDRGSASEKKKTKRAPGSGLAYLPGLDGLRAFAVLVVLLYHADLHIFSGGFLGVEIFFVISGYLITSLILVEWQEQGRIDLKHFWLRRARRLLPALFLLLLSTLTFAVIALPGEVASLRRDVAAAIGYATNWYLILSQQSYFESVGRPSLLRHLWSLAVEEQFYVVWPLLLTLLLRHVRLNRVLYIVLAGSIASTLLMAVLYQPDVDPSRVYYGTDTRASGILLGAALAFAWRPWQIKKQAQRLNPFVLDLAGVAGLAVLVWATLWINEFDPFLYRGGFTVVSVATALVIAVVAHPKSRLGRRLLAWPPLVWIGVRSYGLYLWHWPIYMVTRPQLDVALDGLPLFALRLAATFALTAASYRFVETPIRTGGLGRAWKSWRESTGVRLLVLTFSGATVFSGSAVFLVLLGQFVAAAQPPPPPDYLAELAVNTPVSQDASPPVLSSVSDPVTVDLSSASSSSLLPDPSPTPEEAPASDAPDLGATANDDIEWRVSGAPPVDIDAVPTLAPARATPRPTEPPLVTGVRVTAIGDSVMLGAVGALHQAVEGIDVDAQMSRQVGAAVNIIRARQVGEQLGEVVVIHMGTNGSFSSRQFDQMMESLSGARRVIFINDRVPRAWQDTNNAVLAEGVKRYPQAVLLDWVGASANRPELFWQDGIHLRPEGAKFYAGLIADAINAP